MKVTQVQILNWTRDVAKLQQHLKDATAQQAKALVDWQNEDKENVLHLCKPVCLQILFSGERSQDFRLRECEWKHRHDTLPNSSELDQIEATTLLQIRKTKRPDSAA